MEGGIWPGPVVMAVVLAVMSAMCFALMGIDKFCAVNRWRRIPEFTLLFWSMLGGAPGTKLAQHVFRHKTRKQPFAMWLNIGVLISAIASITIAILLNKLH